MQVSTAITFNFIWDNKMAKIKKRNHTIIGELKNGGLNMIDSTQFISCIKRFHLTENTAQHGRLSPNEAILQLGGITFLSTCNCDSNDLNIKELPPFYE